MCATILMALLGVFLGQVIGHAFGWLIPRLVRVLPTLLGGAMAISMFYALAQIALGP